MPHYSQLLEADFPEERRRLLASAEGAMYPVKAALNLGYQFGLDVGLKAREARRGTWRQRLARRLRKWANRVEGA